MNKNINLCEILKGHEGESFYCSLTGKVLDLHEIVSNMLTFKSPFVNRTVRVFNDGAYYIGGECIIFPSKDPQDWNKWIEEQKLKVPKTWSELVKENRYQPYFAEIHIRFSLKDKCAYGKNPIEKSAAALLKIHQIIEAGYGGNVTEWEYPCVDKYIITPTLHIEKVNYKSFKSHIAFHTIEQAEEFLKYPENVQLLNDYFMV